MRTCLTRRLVLDHHSSSSVEDDVSTIIKVMQVVATVEAPVAKHMIQEQLLESQHNRGDTDRTKLSVTWSE